MTKKLLILSLIISIICMYIISMTPDTIIISDDSKSLGIYQKPEITLSDLRAKKILWNKDFPQKDINHQSLTATNADYIGWLSFHFNPDNKEYNIDIEEPVVLEQKYAPDFYLKHKFDKTPDKNGSIFMDYDSDSSLYGTNDFLYAHHATDGGLFGTLNHIYEFNDKNYFKTHPLYMYIYTETACHKYVMIGYEQIENSTNHYAYTFCEDMQMYYDYIDYLKSLQNYIPSDEIQWDTEPELMNFSTCDGESGTTHRFVIHFAKIQAYALH